MNAGDTAWLLVSAGLVMLMTPGLALFYGGMVQGKNVLSTFMHSFFALGLVSVQFAVLGYTLAFGTSWHGVIGGLDFPASTVSTRSRRPATCRTWRSSRTSACSR